MVVIGAQPCRETETMPNTDERPELAADGFWSRERVLLLVLAAATVLLIYLCWLLARPFLAPLAWALALGLVARPVHVWIARRVGNRSLSAALATTVIALVIIAPAAFVAHQLAREASAGLTAVHDQLESGAWRAQLAQSPRLARLVSAIEQQGDIAGHLQTAAREAAGRLSTIVAGSVLAVVELVLTLFILFFFFRDRALVLGALRSLVPLSGREADEVFSRVDDTVHATIYGTLTVAAVQGALGGLMFWWLGLPAPVLWGAVMALLAVVPVLGAFVIWVPAAIFLGLTGHWGKAVILTVWGALVIGVIDNLLYPMLVGKRLRLHTVPVFISIVGGLALFGAAGLILGPLVLALTDAILEIWRRRTAHGGTAESAPAQE